MNAKQLEGRVRLITDGGIRITLRRATMTDGVTSEIDAFIPLSAIMSLDLSGTLAVREDWVVENLGTGFLGPQPTLEAPKSSTAAQRASAWRKIRKKYHPDSSDGRALFPVSEIASDLNELYDQVGGRDEQ